MALTRPINNACSDSGPKFELSSITQAQAEQQAKFQQRRKKSPTIMGWIYIDNTRLCNLGLKSPLCWKQLDHTKGRHTETILTEN